METNRLSLKLLSPDDAGFIFELLNTDEWIKYIGDRNIHTLEDGRKYIQAILDNEHADYWVVELKNESKPIGTITCMQRDYLKNKDIGFAFLPEYAGKGYAFESAHYILNELLKTNPDKIIHSIIRPDNKKSIRLIEKLGFTLTRTLMREEGEILLYSLL